MNYSPSAVAPYIFSEPLEVFERRGTFTFDPVLGRVLTTFAGIVLPLSITSNGLGWLGIEIIKDVKTIAKLFKERRDALLAGVASAQALLVVSIPRLRSILSPSLQFLL